MNQVSNTMTGSEPSGKPAQQPNIQAIVQAAHDAASGAEQALASLSDRLNPILSDLKSEGNNSTAPAPAPDKLHQSITGLESRFQQMEAWLTSILNRLHL